MSTPSRITDGSIAGALFRLGWPVTLSFFLYTSFVIIDSIWIGRLGSDALAASGPSQFASWSIYAIGEIIAIGATAIIARRIGAGEMRDAGLTLIQGCWMVVIAGLLLAGGGALFARTLYANLGTSEIVNALGVRYLSILCYGAIFQFAGIFLESVLRSAGNTRTPMFITAGGLALNAILDPVLMFGWWGAPALGIAGAAIATVGSQALIVVVYLFYFRAGRATVPVLPRTEWKFDSYITRRIIQIGLPASSITFLFTIVYLFLTRFLAEFGTAPVAILGVGNRLEAITYLFGHGLSIATSTMVGQNLGAGKPDRAEKTAWYASAIASGFGLGVT
ncbi:MAG: MATE family efflux transporter, partial [Gemmatimonadetes bacterium]|nr:MATE family efflux transporter [Gemmatimonadota bacterium]